jgi:lysine-N-methylase
MFQFTTRRLFASVTLVATGCGLLSSFFAIGGGPEPQYAPALCAWFLVLAYFAAGPLIGAGIFNLAKRPRLGAVLGLIAETLVPAILFLREPHFGSCGKNYFKRIATLNHFHPNPLVEIWYDEWSPPVASLASVASAEMKLRPLPILELWDCQGCTACCRETTIRLNDEDVAKIEQQRWHAHPDFRGVRVVRRSALLVGARVLAHKPDGSCVFLTAEGRCRIHEEFGGEAKPLVCQQFPLQVVTSDRAAQVTVLRSCPTAAAGRGKPIREHLPLLKRLLGDAAEKISAPAVPPPLVGRVARTWDNFHRVAGSFERLLTDARLPLVRRVAHAVRLSTLLAQLNWSRVELDELTELLQVLEQSAIREAGEFFTDRRPPAPRTAKLFRRLGAHFIRCYPGGQPTRSMLDHWRVFRASGKLARATTAAPQLHANFPAISIDQLDRPLGPLAPDVLAPLAAFFESHAVSKRYTLAHPNRALLESVRTLAFAFPMALWMLRWLAPDRPPTVNDTAQIVVALERGLELAALPRAVSFFAESCELERLIAWHGR